MESPRKYRIHLEKDSWERGKHLQRVRQEEWLAYAEKVCFSCSKKVWGRMEGGTEEQGWGSSSKATLLSKGSYISLILCYFTNSPSNFDNFTAFPSNLLGVWVSTAAAYSSHLKSLWNLDAQLHPMLIKSIHWNTCVSTFMLFSS